MVRPQKHVDLTSYVVEKMNRAITLLQTHLSDNSNTQGESEIEFLEAWTTRKYFKYLQMIL